MSRRIHVTSAGPFGHSAAEWLGRLEYRVTETVWAGARPPGHEEADVEVVTAWRPVEGLCELFEEGCWAAKRPLVTAVLDMGVLRVGPVIVPGMSGCWRCWTLRRRQHSPARREEAALHRYYDSRPREGPAGHLPGVALLAAAQVARVLNGLGEPADVAGRIWQMDLFSGEVKTGRLVGVDGCSRCGLDRPWETRTYVEAREALRAVWERR